MLISNTFCIHVFLFLLAKGHTEVVAASSDSTPISLRELAVIVKDLVEPMWAEISMLTLAALVYLLACSERAIILRAKTPLKLFENDVVKDRTLPTSIGKLASWNGEQVGTASGKSKDRVVKNYPRLGKLERRAAAEAADCTPPGDRAATMQLQLVMQAKQISSAGKAGLLQIAISIFLELKKSETQLTTLVYNCLLDACVQCGDLRAALGYFAEAKENQLADVVSYNTVMKGHLAKGDTAAVRRLLVEMPQRNLQPTRIAYHCLLNALVQSGDLRGTWKVTEQMEGDGLQLNVVTCSILLKTVTARSQAHELDHVMSLVDKVDTPMDEVLFASVVEACIRSGRLELLSDRTKQYARSGGLNNLSAPIYGSMIKAYGQAHDLERIWELWTEMQQRKVIPTAITLGCMVEALVMNKSVEDAWQLVQEVWKDEAQRPSVNTVVYSTIIKGYAMSKQHCKITALYDEMKVRGIPRNTITFNTMLNALARCGFMDRVPQILEEMHAIAPAVMPDIVTYSTIVKGYCMCGELDKAFPLLAEMKKDVRLVPDEVTYNSLLDGCARQRRLDDAMWLLDDMKASGVVPSNYTLSIVLKLLGRAKRLTQAFSMVDTFSAENGFKPNIQVYTCLIQACFHNRQLEKALGLHDRIVCEGHVILDEKTYTVLARGCLAAGDLLKAEWVVRCAYHLSGHGLTQTKRAPCGLDAGCLQDVLEALGRNSVAAQNLVSQIPSR